MGGGHNSFVCVVMLRFLENQDIFFSLLCNFLVSCSFLVCFVLFSFDLIMAVCWKLLGELIAMQINVSEMKAELSLG